MTQVFSKMQQQLVLPQITLAENLVLVPTELSRCFPNNSMSDIYCKDCGLLLIGLVRFRFPPLDTPPSKPHMLWTHPVTNPHSARPTRAWHLPHFIRHIHHFQSGLPFEIPDIESQPSERPPRGDFDLPLLKKWAAGLGPLAAAPSCRQTFEAGSLGGSARTELCKDSGVLANDARWAEAGRSGRVESSREIWLSSKTPQMQLISSATHGVERGALFIISAAP